MRRLLPLLPFLLATPAGAQPLHAVYEVYAGGFTVLEFELALDVRDGAYRVQSAFRTRGMAATFAPGEQVTRAEGGWRGAEARPSAYSTEGQWRGRARRIVLGWEGVDPVVRTLDPPEEEREAVPAEMRRGTVDLLSALASLTRRVQQTGRCEATLRVFDGRRLSDYAAVTETRDRIAPWRSAWHGEALRCGFEARQVAGFRRDQSREEAAAPHRGTAWLATPYAGAPPIPVRVDIPTRWFGTATAVLVRAEPLRTEQAWQERR